MISMPLRKAAKVGLGLLGAGAGLAYAGQLAVAEQRSTDDVEAIEKLKLQLTGPMPPRQQQWARLAEGTREQPYDLFIIGGGATGTGCAVDAVTRGLRTALVEGEDFAAGTSSKSTKLVHGGVRYLEKAVFNFDTGQLKLVFEALHERKHMLENAPHLCDALPIMTPCYKLWEIPYYWLGLKAYDAVAGTQGLTMSRFTSASESRRQFPTLAAHGPDSRGLKGTIVYYDGQFDDSRLCTALACTAALAGATVLNHTSVTSLIKDDHGKVHGVHVQDNLMGHTQAVYARQVINATGPFVDKIRRLSDDTAPRMIMPSSGVHVTLPDYYSPEHLGMIVPKTKDGRVVFMLPWQSATIAGTTDSSTEITMQPRPKEEEICFILEAISEYLTVDVRRSDVLSTWAGIRPLATDPNAHDTASASRDHIATVDPDGLLTITGGKWTTYRRMAQDAVDLAIKTGGLQGAGPCHTVHLPLLGAAGWSPELFTEVAQHYTVPHRPGAIDTRVAKHLAAAYGDRARMVTQIAEQRGLGRRLARGHPMLEAEVVYAVQHEMCETPEDFIARRTRLAFLDTRACSEALPKICELMAKEKGWWPWKRRAELRRARHFLETFSPPPSDPVAAQKVAEQARAEDMLPER